MYTWGYIKENTLSKLNLTEEEANQQNFLSRFPYYANEAMTQICSAIKPREKFFVTVIGEHNLGLIGKMPEDFVSFSDSPIYFSPDPEEFGYGVVSDSIISYHGYNEFSCNRIGFYKIPYNARWIFFTKDLHNDTVIDAPADVCDALPSYIASQCLKIDDEAKAAIYRNEYEMFLARLDDTSVRLQKEMYIGGGW